MRVFSEAAFLLASTVLRLALRTLQGLSFCYGLFLAVRYGLSPK
jgi:hypothetical protein